MKNFVIAILALAFVPIAQAQLKIGVLDMERIFASYHKTGETEAKLKAARTAALDATVEKLKSEKKEFDALDIKAKEPHLNEESKRTAELERDNKAADIRDLERQVDVFRSSQEKALQPAFLPSRKDLLDDIMKIVKAKCEADSYDIVFDKSALGKEQVPIVLYSSHDTIVDFTKEVIEALTKK